MDGWNFGRTAVNMDGDDEWTLISSLNTLGRRRLVWMDGWIAQIGQESTDWLLERLYRRMSRCFLRGEDY